MNRSDRLITQNILHGKLVALAFNTLTMTGKNKVSEPIFLIKLFFKKNPAIPSPLKIFIPSF